MSARSERAENAVQVLVLLAVGGMAGAASFTHMHDWTMANAPAGTGDWFGWANAVVADLIPMAAALEVRRRRRAGQPTGYPLAVLVGFALLSLAAQVACAKPSASGWLLASVPALGFLALTKLVLSRTPVDERPETSVPVSAEIRADAGRKPEPVRAEITAPVERKPVTAEAEVPAPGERKPAPEAALVSASFPLQVLPGAGRKPAPEIGAVLERKPARKPAALQPAERTPESILAAAEALKAEDPGLPWTTIAERLGVTDRRLRQIRSGQHAAV